MMSESVAKKEMEIRKDDAKLCIKHILKELDDPEGDLTIATSEAQDLVGFLSQACTYYDVIEEK